MAHATSWTLPLPSYAITDARMRTRPPIWTCHASLSFWSVTAFLRLQKHWKCMNKFVGEWKHIKLTDKVQTCINTNINTITVYCILLQLAMWSSPIIEFQSSTSVSTSLSITTPRSPRSRLAASHMPHWLKYWCLSLSVALVGYVHIVLSPQCQSLPRPLCCSHTWSRPSVAPPLTFDDGSIDRGDSQSAIQW